MSSHSKSALTHDYLIQNFFYDPSTGEFYRKTPDGLRRLGFVNRDGYLVANIKRKIYLIHRIAWFYVTGEMPKNDIDHIDGDRKNNKFDNIRSVTKAVNRQNLRSAMPFNKTGLLGVQVHHGKYRATINVAGTQIRLGRFDTKEEAHEAYLKAKRRIHVGCTI